MTADAAENYRKAALSLLNFSKEGGCQSIVFTGCKGGEGTTTTLLGVAKSLKECFSNRVLVLEMNLTRPELVQRLSLDRSRTLHAAADRRKPAAECIQRSAAGVDVLAVSLDRKDDSTNLDVAPLLRRLLDEVQSNYDLILIDSPPLLSSAQAWAICSVVPRVVLITESGRTRREVLHRVHKDLTQAKVAIVGSVLNKQDRYIPGWLYRVLAS